jgi:FlaA1/EpsC-like NDP-sugar epimerase
MNGHTLIVMTTAGTHCFETADAMFGHCVWREAYENHRQGSVKRSFAGKSVVVTGAGGGIGAAIARRFAARGAHVAVADTR